jgi:glycosyltransferase involved in cell wall biosynthesis
MIVAVDARELSGRPTGVGRYLAELLEEWAVLPDARRHEWRLFTHQALSLPAVFLGQVSTLPGQGGTKWEQWTLSRALARERPDVLFAPGYTAPLAAPCPVVLAVHDVSFAAHPSWFTAREGFRRRVLTAWSARRAASVLTLSEFSKREIIRHLGVPAGRIRVVPLGTRLPLDQSAGQPREAMVLFVGSIFRRRNVDHLIRAFATEVAPRVPQSTLEIVGENRSHPPIDLEGLLRELPEPVRARITLHSYVEEPLLRSLYARASVFVFLSEYEGFGLTPLEALAAGVPPIVLDTPVAREVYGGAARYVDLKGTGSAIADLLTDAAHRQRLLEHASDTLKRFDWSRTAAATLQALHEAAGAAGS